VQHYFQSSFYYLEDKTRGIIVSIVNATLDPFLRYPLRELFCSDTTFTPEDIFQQRRVVIVDLSPMQYFEAGRVGSSIFRYLLQRSLMARDATRDSAIGCLWVDEYSLSAMKHDALFVAVARSQRGHQFNNGTIATSADYELGWQ
jgi:hypothetical protein